MFKAGDVVRHQVQELWGLGRVVDLTPDGKVRVRFVGRPDDVLLTASGAETHLRLDAAEWQDRPKARTKGKATAPVSCITCGKKLGQAYTFARAGWRACPECSRKNKRPHVLYAFPQGFEMPDASGAVAPVDPAQAGWCIGCRTDGAQSAGTAKVCSDFER
jgi:hypothetical protein